MNREEAIKHIEALYPADSEFGPTCATGKRLLEQARQEVLSWRSEPTDVLIRYAELCIERENMDLHHKQVF